MSVGVSMSVYVSVFVNVCDFLCVFRRDSLHLQGRCEYLWLSDICPETFVQTCSTLYPMNVATCNRESESNLDIPSYTREEEKKNKSMLIKLSKQATTTLVS